MISQTKAKALRGGFGGCRRGSNFGSIKNKMGNGIRMQDQYARWTLKIKRFLEGKQKIKLKQKTKYSNSLGTQFLIGFTAFRKRVEAMSGSVIRLV